MAGPYPIWLKAITLPTHLQAYSLLTRMQIVDTAAPKQAMVAELQLDPDAGGFLYVGNEDVSISNWAVKLVPGQAWAPPTFQTSMLPLGVIYLLSSITDSALVGVTAITR